MTGKLLFGGDKLKIKATADEGNYVKSLSVDGVEIFTNDDTSVTETVQEVTTPNVWPTVYVAPEKSLEVVPVFEFAVPPKVTFHIDFVPFNDSLTIDNTVSGVTLIKPDLMEQLVTSTEVINYFPSSFDYKNVTYSVEFINETGYDFKKWTDSESGNDLSFLSFNNSKSYGNTLLVSYQNYTTAGVNFSTSYPKWYNDYKTKRFSYVIGKEGALSNTSSTASTRKLRIYNAFFSEDQFNYKKQASYISSLVSTYGSLNFSNKETFYESVSSGSRDFYINCLLDTI